MQCCAELESSHSTNFDAVLGLPQGWGGPVRVKSKIAKAAEAVLLRVLGPLTMCAEGQRAGFKMQASPSKGAAACALLIPSLRATCRKCAALSHAEVAST